jgi:hypothetical protein
MYSLQDMADDPKERQLCLDDETFQNVDFSYKKFIFPEMAEVRFESCELNAAVFAPPRARSGMPGSPLTLERVSFVNSSLRHAEFLNCDFYGVDLANCDLTGAHFTDCVVSGRLRLVGSNVTAEQVADLMKFTEPQDRRHIEYSRLTPEEVKQATGWDDDEFFARVWAGDVEVRDNKTREVVTDGSFNADRHHIPRWGVPNPA